MKFKSTLFQLNLQLKVLFSVFISLLSTNLLANSKHISNFYLYNWNNYLDEQGKKEVEKTCKLNIVQDYYSDNEEMLAKFSAGANGYDLVVPTQNAVGNLIKQKALKPLKLELIPNFKHLKTGFIHQSFDVKNQFSVPYAYSVTVLGFNETALQKAGIDLFDTSNSNLSWDWFFNPKILQKLKGKITVLDSQRELLGMALKYLGYSVNDRNIKHWEQAKELIIKSKPYWAAFNASSYAKELAVGNIWLAHGYSNDLYQAQKDAKLNFQRQKFKINYGIPKEGAILAIDSLVVHHQGKSSEKSIHCVINELLKPEIAVRLTNYIGAGTPNQSAEKLISPEMKIQSTITISNENMKKLELLEDFTPQERRRLNRIWTEIKLR